MAVTDEDAPGRFPGPNDQCCEAARIELLAEVMGRFDANEQRIAKLELQLATQHGTIAHQQATIAGLRATINQRNEVAEVAADVFESLAASARSIVLRPPPE